MKLDMIQNAKLSFKNARIGVNDNGEVMVCETTKDGVESNNFLEALMEVFHDSESGYDITISRKVEM